MTVQTVTVDLPTTLYNRLKRRAEQTQRPIEAEIIDAVAGALPADDDLPPELSRQVAALAAADDETLWQMLRGTFPRKKSARLESLNLQHQAGEWNDELAQEVEQLATELEDYMFLRAQAMAVLMQRGYDLSTFGKQ